MVLRLVSCVFHLAEVERLAMEAGLTNNLSPQVSSSMMWFIEQWLVMYLLPNEKLYTQVSIILKLLVISFDFIFK